MQIWYCHDVNESLSTVLEDVTYKSARNEWHLPLLQVPGYLFAYEKGEEDWTDIRNSVHFLLEL
jgi:hypothetical protein